MSASRAAVSNDLSACVESWEAFVKALGSDIPSYFTGKHKSIYKFSKLGEVNADGMEKFRHELIILPESSGFKRVLDFKLGEEDSDGKLKVEIHVPGKPKPIREIT
ncbi:hypothetical protein BV898_01118 [Hypsibius exemplaris]|uniref:Uncharacterized protein n=1 Tax=Hypsibius exemplaris TaxID=2072580 RepID=A0A1W0XBS5_HYPEX|nr:hypothetical protein BV898_01118 [Hypsibius exemplaris]